MRGRYTFSIARIGALSVSAATVTPCPRELSKSRVTTCEYCDCGNFAPWRVPENPTAMRAKRYHYGTLY
jgi:hypothetical protein